MTGAIEVPAGCRRRAATASVSASRNASIGRSLGLEMKKNTAMQRFAIEVITAQLNLLQAVIAERA